MQQQELDNLMQASAADAVNYAAEEYKLALDYSIDSLQLIDVMLADLHSKEQQQRHSAEVVFTLCNIMGAYIGELFIANVGGNWQHDKSDSEAPFVYIRLNEKEFPFSSVCYHKITRDNSISLYHYVKQAKANAMQ